ncbi:putative salicylate hydroxylase [Poronia punctata]|nr:putative salicylate hydroxylase [Poronia punctata]
MDSHEEASFSQRRAVRPLSVIVVGAGIGGLAVALCMQKTGHNVVILEKRHSITEVGAGIQLAPNMARILRRFGILDEVMKYATVLEGVSVRRWENDEELNFVPMVPHIESTFGAPVAVVHRADLQRVLLDAAIKSGCQVLTGHTVVDIDEQFSPLTNIIDRRLLVRKNRRYVWMNANLVAAADGVNSVIRKRMAYASGSADKLRPTTQLAYRFLLPRGLIQQDVSLTAALGENRSLRYMGPGGHVMVYPLRDNTVYNVVLLRETDKDRSRGSSWTTRAKKEEAMEHYREWCPLVQSLIRYAPTSEILKTPMCDMPPLPTWVKGQVALAGDACHYMFPYVAQGAANAIEDAGALAMAFTCTGSIDRALEVYQLVRKARSEKIQNSATDTGRTLHLPDGEEQRQRDDAIRGTSGPSAANPDKWNDRQSREFMWGFDVMAETLNSFASTVQ